MLCPHCKTDLKTINLDLITQIYKKNDYTDNVDVDICPSCHGVWLDKGELQKLIETHAPIFNGAGQADRNASIFVEANRKDGEKLWEGEISCPKCGKLMQKSRYAVTSDPAPIHKHGVVKHKI